jgi:ribose transport system substrate-binding protein
MRVGRRSSNRHGGIRLPFLALGLMASLTAACGSSGGSTSSGGASSSSSPSSNGATAAAVQKATAFIQPFLTAPTKIPLTEPLTTAPAAGKTIVFLQCELAQCKVISDGVKDAAALVKWTFKSIPYQATNPSTLIKGMDQALQYHPVAVAMTSPPYALWSQEVAKYKRAGVGIIPSFTGAVPLDSTIVADPASPEFSAKNGDLLANWFIADSNAQGHVLSASVPDFPYLGDVSKEFDKVVSSDCPECKLTKLNIGIPDLGSGAIVTDIVSALRKDPSITYMIGSDAAFLPALPAALKAAGLGGKVKLGGCCGVAAVEQGLMTGEFSAITGVNGNYAAYITMDAALRLSQGLPIPSNEGDLPVGLLTKDSLGAQGGPSDSYNQPADYVQQFKTLWKIS